MKAVIFDMDGVLVDSEKFWQQAERKVFSSLGVAMDEDECALTKTMTTNEVTRFWFQKSPWAEQNFKEVEEAVISNVIELIENENCEIKGVHGFVKHIKARGYKVGLATNSPYRIIPAVLKKTGLTPYFDAVSSAEFEVCGKPDPAVYVRTSGKLGINPIHCLAIEDSFSGIAAAKRAGMTVVGYSHGHSNTHLEGADFILPDFEAAQGVLGL